MTISVLSSRPAPAVRSGAPIGALGVRAGLLLCLALVAVPLLAAGTPPLFDYPNHLARVHILHHWDRLALFHAHYGISSFLVPNVLSDLVLLGFMAFGDAHAAGRALLLVIAWGTLTGVLALNRAATGRASVWPLLGALLVFNEMFVWGFLNYLLGLVLLLWGMAAWLWLERRPRAVQVAVGTAFALSLFLSHLVAFGLYGVAIAILELRRVWRAGTLWRTEGVGRLVVSAAQFVPALTLFLWVSPSSGLPVDLRFDYSLWGKLSPFARLLSTGNPIADTGTLVLVVAIVAIGLATRRIGLHRDLALVAGADLLLVLVLPYSALGSFFLDARIVIATALVAIAAVTPRVAVDAGDVADRQAGARRWDRRPLLAVILVLVGVRTVVLVRDWHAQSEQYRPVLAALDRLPPGSILVAGSAAPFELGDWFSTRRIRPPREHVATYATVDADVLVPNVFARAGQNPLVYTPAREEMAPLGRNPILRLFGPDGLRHLATEAARVASRRNVMDPPPTGVFVIAHHVRCDAWPADVPVRAAACGPDFSLMEVVPVAAGPAPDTRGGTAEETRMP